MYDLTPTWVNKAVRPATVTTQTQVVATQALQNRAEYIPIASSNPAISATAANAARNNAGEGYVCKTYSFLH
jgi:hypothetical protein